MQTDSKNPPYCDGSHNQFPDAMTQELPTDWIAFETVDVKEESHDTKRFRFRVKDCKNDLAKLRSLKLKDGQTFHFSVRVEMPDGNLSTRPYTPTYFDFKRGEGEFVIKRYDDGKVTPTLTDKRKSVTCWTFEVLFPASSCFNMHKIKLFF